MQVPEPHMIVPDGMPETTWKAMPASTWGFSKTPALSIAFAPVNPSSSG